MPRKRKHINKYEQTFLEKLLEDEIVPIEEQLSIFDLHEEPERDEDVEL